jgi:hypothetical protein
MKNSTKLLTAVVLLFTFSSCSKIKEATQRDIVVTPGAINFTIPVTASTTDQTFGEQNVDLDLNALIKAQASEFGEDNVKKVKIKTITLEVLNKDANNDISNFEKFDVKISTGGTPVSIAANTTIPNTPGLATITVEPTGSTDLKSYLTASSFKYALTGKLRKATTIALQIKLTATYDFTVGL